MAWYRPDLYHRVLTYSGTYVNQQWPPSAETPRGAWEFHERLIPNSPAKPIRIWMQVGDRDLFNPNVMRDDMHDWVLANEHMAQVLAAKGYRYQFVVRAQRRPLRRGVKQQTLPAALEWLWKGYTPGRGTAWPVKTSVLNPIGVIRSELRERKGAPKQGSEGAPDAWLEVYPWATAGLHLLAAGDESSSSPGSIAAAATCFRSGRGRTRAIRSPACSRRGRRIGRIRSGCTRSSCMRSRGIACASGRSRRLTVRRSWTSSRCYRRRPRFTAHRRFRSHTRYARPSRECPPRSRPRRAGRSRGSGPRASAAARRGGDR